MPTNPAVHHVEADSNPLYTPREFFMVALLIFLALMQVRKMLWWIPTNDTRTYFLPWLEFIHQHGGWHALRYPFSEYFPMYLYLLAGVSYLSRWLSPLTQIKIIPTVFDVVVAVFAYRIVALLQQGNQDSPSARSRPLVAALVVLALPSLILDGSLWGQCDSIYLSFLLATMYYLMRNAPVRTCVYYGVAMCFKFQAIFLAPVLLVALLRRRLSWWQALLIPIIWIVGTIPAVLMGRSFYSIISLFVTQSRLFPDVALNVANPYQYFHVLHIPNAMGVWLAGLVTILAFGALLYIGLARKRLDREWLFFFATCSLAVMPYVMPKMHDRYFLPAQVFLVILACCKPRFVIPAVLLEFALLLSYLNFFHNWGILDGMKIAVLTSTAALFILLRELWRTRNT